jgi:HSP20 family protein
MSKKGTKKKTENVPVAKKEEEKPEYSRAMTHRDQSGYWQPFDLMRQFEREMDDLFRDFQSTYFYPRRFQRHGGYRVPSVRLPLLDIEDTGKNLMVTAEMPGIPKENIDIKVTENSLEISAKTQEDIEEKGKEYYHRERRYKSFQRNLPLPAEVNHKKTDAKLKDGILKVILPKKKEESLKDKIHRVLVK